MSRQTDRQQLRLVGEFISKQMLPGVPRKLRRLMGRVYGNAGYRKMNDLSHDIYGDGPNGYSHLKPHPQVTKWVAEEGKKVLTEVEPAPLPPEMDAAV